MPSRLTPFLALTILAAATPAVAHEAAKPEQRARLRDLGITVGVLPTGRWNAITDVPGVKVGHVTLVSGSGKLVPGQGPVRTGVTAIIPRDDVWNKKVFAGGVVLNGNGQMAALDWVRESGWLETPILLCDTLSVGRVTDAAISWAARNNPQMGVDDDVVLPCVAECDDSFLNDQRGRHVKEQHVFQALDGAKTGPVAEGAVGAGTGMVAYRFKGGIGTASRKLPADAGGYTVGVLVNANLGWREHLRIAGMPVGEQIKDLMPESKPSEGSCIMILATDAPLLPNQLERLARRATLGLARTGTVAAHSSGDFALAFSTATVVPHYPEAKTMTVTALNTSHISPLFAAAVEATEEAVGNALTMATTTVGRDGHKVHALPLDRLKAIMKAGGRSR